MNGPTHQEPFIYSILHPILRTKQDSERVSTNLGKHACHDLLRREQLEGIVIFHLDADAAGLRVFSVQQKTDNLFIQVDQYDGLGITLHTKPHPFCPIVLNPNQHDFESFGNN